MNHTPGPWKLTAEYPTGRCEVRSSAPNSFVVESADEANRRCDELNAQERVRDAADELLAVCQRVKNFLDHLQRYGDVYSPSINEALDAAIKKATA